MDQLNVKNYFVEIGGEIKVKGRNNEGKDWRIGIDKPIDNPKDGTRELIQVINLTNCALATSGNYRKFYIKEGKKYAHTLNPISGYPAENDLLSATVITNSTAEADALATSFMVMGLEETKSWLRQNPQIRAYLVYTNAEGKHEIFKTKGLKLN